MKFNLLFAFITAFNILYSQTTENIVTLTTSGTGKTIEEAKNNALRSAIEQAFGAFISSKTEILNDELISDQITSVSSGNIQSFEIRSQEKLSDELYGITMYSVVSVDKLISFVQSKGVSVEIKGGLFAANVKQQMLNEKAEVEAMLQLIGNIHEPLQNSFNYSIKSSEPISKDDNNLNWAIPLEVTASTNENFVSCSKYLYYTLKALSLSSDEVRQYKSMNKSIFPITVTFENTSYTFTFRKIQSIYVLQSLADNFNWFYDEQFLISWGDTAKSISRSAFSINDVNQLFNVFVQSKTKGDGYNPPDDPRSYSCCVIKLPPINTVTKSFVGLYLCTLQDLENLSGFNIASRGIVSRFDFGGFVFYETEGYRIEIEMNTQNPQLIDSVFLNGAGYLGGLKKGDLIKSINGVNIGVSSNLSELIQKSPNADKSSEFEIQRGAETLKIEILPKKKKSYLVMLPFTFGGSNFDQAVSICDELRFGGYNDWKLPTYSQMNYMHQLIFNRGFGNFLDWDRRYDAESEFYWCQKGKSPTCLKIYRVKEWPSHPDYLDKIERNESNCSIEYTTGFFIPIRVVEIDIN
jgi:hypothetical protein